MIRFVIALFIFAVALCAMIVLRPATQTATRAPIISTDMAAVTRAQTENLITDLVQQPADARTQAPVTQTVPPAIKTDNSVLSNTTNNVLAGLGLGIEITPELQANDEMLQATAGVLSGIGAVTGQQITPTAATPAPTSPLEHLVVDALQQGKSDSVINDLVNEAALAGSISVPKVLVTADGRVDTQVLLSSIVSQAVVVSGGAAPSVPTVPSGDGTGVEVRVVQRATTTEQYRFYTVSQGDSLGAIAVKFYGNVDKFGLIFEANRSVLSSPDRIQVGQRLTIPEIS